MPIATNGKVHRETWEDWAPADAVEPESLITRDELLARLAAVQGRQPAG